MIKHAKLDYYVIWGTSIHQLDLYYRGRFIDSEANKSVKEMRQLLADRHPDLTLPATPTLQIPP
jgi:hypothetical protein